MNENALPPELEVSNKTTQREQEGWMRSLSVPEDVAPTCSSFFSANNLYISDFRGPLHSTTSCISPHLDRKCVEWETTPVEEKETTIFTWIGGSQVRPVSSSYPPVTATLFINGREQLKFPLGRPNDWLIQENDVSLSFESRRFLSLVEIPHRVGEPEGISGFYHLSVPERLLMVGEPLHLRVELSPPADGKECLFFVSPRADALRVDLKILRNEVVRLQQDMVLLKQSHEQLYAQFYPELFPELLKGERRIVYQDQTKHLHPATITIMRDGEIVLTMREGTDHIAPDGKLILLRSRDGGNTWSEKETIFSLANADHRAGPIFELANGDWVSTDYRFGGGYTPEGERNPQMSYGASLWAAWSTDKGKNWEVSEKPLTVPSAPYQFCEVERHMICLPSGRLLVAANFFDGDRDPGEGICRIAIFCSDDNGRNWRVLAELPRNPCTVGEATLLQTAGGKIILLSRTQYDGEHSQEKGGLLQSDSHDDGATWSEWRQTGMSSMGAPGHLLQLQDGRILCSHASRLYPGSIFVTTSDDEGTNWNVARTRTIANDVVSWDACYPTTGQKADGTLITVWYANLFGKFFIPSMTYRPEQL